MKKIYFLALLLLSVTAVAAQSKRLHKIALVKSYGEESATLSYDDQGRVSQMVLSDGGGTTTATLSYESADRFVMSHAYSEGTDTYTYTLSGGKILTEEIFLDVDKVNVTNTYEYSGSVMTSVTVSQTVKNKTTTMKHLFTWSGGNIVEDKFYYKGEIETFSTCTPSSVSAHPILRVLFGTGDGYPREITDELITLLPTYQYMGTLPEKPWSKVEQQDYYENKTKVYNYDYVLNNEGDVVQVKVTKEGSTSSSPYRTYNLEWEGSSTDPVTPPTTELPTADNGNETFGGSGSINSNTDLNGNVVGNVYYNIASGNGGYNAVEGCIEITKPTDDSAIEGKDIFGEDFKNHFTGIVFKVAAGTGVVKVNAQTTGSMIIKVKVGNNAPNEMMLTGKGEAKFPYTVTEPTYIYIYASSFTGSAPANRASSNGSDVLRIYDLGWGDTSGIEEVSANTHQQSGIFTLDGRKLNSKPTTKGIYIINGNKVVMK